MKKLILLLALLFPASAYALTPTPDASPSAANPEDVQKIREVVQQKVKEKLQQINTTAPDTTTPKSVFGTITQINGQEIKLNYKDKISTITITDETVFYDLKKIKVNYSTMKVGQDILALGYLNDQNILETKRLLVIDLKLTQNQKQVVVGKIVDISKSSPIIVVIPSKNNSTQYQIKLDTKSLIVDQNNKKYTQSELVSGQKIIVVISPDPKMNNTYYASKIIFNSPLVTPSPTKIATPSAAKSNN